MQAKAKNQWQYKKLENELSTTSNGDEVRRKPQPASAAATDIDTDYYDILVIGRTGFGKSSTVDKLMIPNRHTLSSTQPQTSTSHSSTSSGENITADPTITGKQKTYVDETGEIKHGNLRARIVSEDPEDYETAKKRLEYIADCRGESNPHEKTDELRDSSNPRSVFGITKHCELLTNTDSGVRVLDTPGFFNPQLIDGATNTTDNNFASARHIIKIQDKEKMKIKRIVYFLPQRGRLNRADRSMQEEIKVMVEFFGKSITKCMVLVGTVHEDVSKLTDMSSEKKLSTGSLCQSARYFHETFQRELAEQREDNEELPVPPIIFIAMSDTCEEIFDKIISAPVIAKEHVELNSRKCTKCSNKLLPLKVQPSGEDFGRDHLEEDSLYCHPIILPMYSVHSVAKGIFLLFKLRWKFTKERCVKCDRKPEGSGDRYGCMKVNEFYFYRGEKVIVQHSRT